MKILEIITEAPLPPDWDHSVFTPNTSYKKKMDYAAFRAQKAGKGSSRTAFIIEHEGRPTVLKVAHNAKGMAQNYEEARILDDSYIESLGITVPMIDYDDKHNEPVWIHLEKAEKVNEKTLVNLMKCGNLTLLINLAANLANTRGATLSYKETIDVLKSDRFKYTDQDLKICQQYAYNLSDLATNFNVGLMDLSRPTNWGLYNGNPVVIDVGYTDAVHRAHYM